jgi:hypothetical protein
MMIGNFAFLRVLTSAICAGALILLSSKPCFSQNALQIHFDGPPLQPPGTQYAVNEYDESGMWFQPSGPGSVLLRNGGGESVYPDNGSAYLQVEEGLNFGFSDGSQFDLISVDLAEFSTVYGNPTTVDFVGYHPDGSTVTEKFTTDGMDGSDFQTFTFQDFADVVSVQVSGMFSMDNLIVAVPEPASISLLLLVGLTLFAIKRQTDI